MTPELTVETEDNPTGWVLVESRVHNHGRYLASRLRAHRPRGAGGVEEFPLCIQPNGRIHELIRLPGDVARLAWVPPENWPVEPPRVSVRRVGWFERTWRMALRVLRTWLRLSEEERRECGLTLDRALLDLPAAYRIATGFRVRFWELPYGEWIDSFDTLRERDLKRIAAHVGRFADPPRFHVVVVADGAGPAAVSATLASLDAQAYRRFERVVIEDDGETVPAALAGGSRDEWIMLLRAGDTLAPHALYWFAWEAQARPDAAVIYSDDDAWDGERSRSAPRFKPDWSPAHLLSTHYVGAAAIFRASAVAAAGGVTAGCCRHGNYGLLLRIAATPGATIAHLPSVLLHRGTAAGSNAWEDPQWCAAAVREYLARQGVAAEVVPTVAGCRRVRYRLPDAPPLVSIIVPTRDAAALLRGCVESLLAKTTYPRYELLVIDNRSSDPAALAYLAHIAAHPAVRVLRHDRPFNYSAINNFAAGEARGEALCLLNNDTEVISPDWLEEMMGHLAQPRVGAVGAKLYYPDGRVQHGGVTVGPGGCANHLHLGLERDAPGYCGRAALAQELSAVTGACLLTWKGIYQDLGGLNERRLTVAFNDIDYCLRLQEAGYRVIYTPHAELYHLESATRGDDAPLHRRLRARREIAYMRRRWRGRMRHDPYYNPNLSYRRPDFSLSESPRVRKPWLAEPA
jgi:GT2 family glycosyltransferase